MADQTIDNMSATWNSGGTTFSAVKINITDTASAIASLLQDFQVGGTSKWSVKKDGSFTAAAGATIGGNSTITGTLGVTGAFTAAAIAGTTGIFSGAVSGTTGTFSGVVGLAGGSAAAPGIGWTGDANTGFYRSADGEIAVSSNGVVKGAWSASGFNVGLGTALISPDGPTVGCSMSTVGAVVSYLTSGTNWAAGRAGSGTVASFTRATVNSGTITIAVGTTAYNTTSDARRKCNDAGEVGKLDPFDSGPILDALDVGRFRWIEDPTVIGYGVLAQDAHEVFPQAITVGNDEEDIPWGADYAKFVPLLLAEIKDLRRRLAAAGL